MFQKNKMKKWIAFILCLCMFFAVGSSPVQASLKDNAFTKVLNTIFEKILEWITELLIKLGDGILHIVIRSVGESVSFDRLVFNDVNRVSVDYWTKDSQTGSIKAIMSPVVSYWYNVFFRIAILVFFIYLVYIGIKIVLSDIGEKKAKYNELLLDWVIGVAILFLFPYVMKYIVQLNNGVVKTFANFQGYQGVAAGDLQDHSLEEAATNAWYGNDEFVQHMGYRKGEAMIDVRQIASKTVYKVSTDEDKLEGAKETGEIGGKTKNDPTLALVYLFLIGEMVVILVMYYKRAFMMAFLITIFPLVAMTYVIDKMGDKTAQTFNTWFKEYVINVVVQIFHALVYVLITGPAINLYINDSGTIVFMIISLLFFFEGEKILRNIFGIKSSAGVVKDLAATGAMVWGTVTGAKNLLKRDKNEIGSKLDQEDVAGAKSRVTEKTKMQENNEKAANEAMGDTPGDSIGEYQGKDREPKGVRNSVYDGERARDSLLTKAMKRRMARGVASKAVNFAFGAAGATMAVTQQMATGQSDIGKSLTAAAGGKALGQEIGKPVTWAVNKGEQIAHGAILAHNVGNGAYDSSLGIDNLGTSVGNIPMGLLLKNGKEATIENVMDLINSGEIEKYDIDVQRIYREALQRYVFAAATGGRARAEVAYWKYLKKQFTKEK